MRSDKVDKLLDQCTPSEHRSMILSDLGSDTHVAAFIEFPYDSPPSETAVAQLFDQTVSRLGTKLEVVWTHSTLPIISHLGRFKVTHVIRDPMGDVSIHDAENHSASFYMSD